MRYCCDELKYHINHRCEIHSNIFDCFDHIFYYNDVYDEYGVIIHDGGSSYIQIKFCPFCGCKFSPSKRDIYFDIIENELKISSEEEIPEEFKTDEWWKKRGL